MQSIAVVAGGGGGGDGGGGGGGGSSGGVEIELLQACEHVLISGVEDS